MNEKKFYHFTSAESARSIFSDGKFIPSKILECNDPFEMDHNPVFIKFKNDDDLKQYVRNIIPWTCERNNILPKEDMFENYFQKIKSKLTCDNLYRMNDIPRFNKDRGNLAIYCFSKVDIRDGILLWSHYAKKHTGVAIEFDFLFRSDVHMYEVQYSKDNFRTGVIPSEELLQYLTKMETCSITQDKWFKRFTSTKHSDWEYEKEWRMLTLSNDHNFLNYMPIDNNKHNYISAVYFGVNIKPDDKDNLIKIIREKFPSIKLFQTTKHDKLIKLDVDAI